MSEDSSNARVTVKAPESEKSTAPPSPPPASARRAGGVAWLALLVALAAVGWHAQLWWQSTLDNAQADQIATETRQFHEQLEGQATRLQSLETELSRLNSDIGRLGSRLNDSDRVNRSLREEVLGVGERANLLEDAVARLAERRLEGQAALRLDEAESLLRTAYERQRLFHDRDGALAALHLADAALATIESAQLINLRQTLRREITELAAHVDTDHAALTRRLDDLRGMVARLPEALPQGTIEPNAMVTPTLTDRLGLALSKMVRVRRIDAPTDWEHFPIEARRATLTLEIELMRANLVIRDSAGWQRSGERLQHLLAEGFDPTATILGSAREIVAELAAARLAAAAPAPELTLRELRNLRALRNLTRETAPSPPAMGVEDVPPGDGAAPQHRPDAGEDDS